MWRCVVLQAGTATALPHAPLASFSPNASPKSLQREWRTNVSRIQLTGSAIPLQRRRALPCLFENKKSGQEVAKPNYAQSIKCISWWWVMDSNQGAAVRNPSENHGSCESGDPERSHGSAHGFVQLWHELAQLVEMWPWVSAESRKAILTLLRAAYGGGHDSAD